MPAARYWDGTKWADLSMGTLGGQYVSFLIGDGLGTSFTLIHRLGSRNVMVACYRTATPWDEVEVDVERTDLDTVTVRTFPTVPALGELTVVVAAPGTQAALNVTMDQWHTVGAAGEPAFQNSWVAYGSPEQPPGFRKFPDGKVRLKGMIRSGSVGAAFTLPVGYRPPYTMYFPISKDVAYGNVTIGTDGAVSISQTSTSWTALSGIEFDTESVLQTASVAAQPLDAMHLVGGTGEPAFQNSWVNYDNSLPSPTSGQRNAGFRKYSDGRVRLKGTIKTGASGAVAFTLPAGYRPPTDIVLTTQGSGGVLNITVQTTGAVVPSGAGAPSYTFLDGIEFDTESVNGYATASFPFLPVTMDTWHTVGATGEPAFAAGCSTSGAQAVQFRKFPDGRVLLRGAINCPTAANSPLFTLPVGYRPPANYVRFSGTDLNTGTQIQLYVDSSGVVTKSPSGVTVTDLSSIEFDTDTVLQTASVAAQGLDAVHKVGAAGEPAFQNSWVNYDAADAGRQARFRKDPTGRVRLAGTIKTGATGTVVFTLPVGYRPPGYVSATVSASGGQAVCQVAADGTVILYQGTGANVSTNAFLDGVEFDTESATSYVTGTFPFLPITMDTWHPVGAVGEPAFENGWKNIAAQTPTAFRKDPSGKVYLRGSLDTGTNNSRAFYLPVGYRPPVGMYFTVLGDSGLAGNYVYIGSDGQVVSTRASVSLYLGTITFDTDTVLQTASVAAQPLDAWHMIGNPGEPAFQNSWVNFALVGDTTVSHAGFRKDPQGRVWLKGVVKTGTIGQPIFTLPVGYRPPEDVRLATFNSMVRITSAGLVYAHVGSNTDFYLDNAQFDTESVVAYASGIIGPARVLALPVSPVDGQECYFVADATNGVLWHLRYNAGSASAYKWEFVGGSSLIAENRASQTASAGAWVMGANPSIALPLAGTYECSYATSLNTTAGGAGQAYVGLYFGGTRDDNGVLGTYSGVAGIATMIASSDYPKTIATPMAMQFGFYCAVANGFTSTVIAARPRRVG